jgi:hypothetical protein
VPIGTSRARINSGSTGFLDIVELKMASPPIMQRRIKGENLNFIGKCRYQKAILALEMLSCNPLPKDVV